MGCSPDFNFCLKQIIITRRCGGVVVVGGGGGTYWKMKMKECSVSKIEWNKRTTLTDEI
jgi:PHP family Zn ribbon phosphoesterase